MVIVSPIYELLDFVLNHQWQQLKRDYLLKQRPWLGRSHRRSFQSHFRIALKTCAKKQSCKFYLQAINEY